MSPQNYKFEGWLAHDTSAVEGKMTWGEFEPKRWEESDIDIKITHCGMCGSDVHTLRSGWYPAPYPIIVGHEIVGEVVRVGSKAAGSHKIGDRVGVGCLTDCCMGIAGVPICEACESGEEQFCPKARWTYPGPHHNGDKGYGGYATYHRCPGRFVFKIPDGLESKQAATMMCAGITMYSPLKRFGCGPGKLVGIVGLGGLGHYGVLLAKAMGADKVVAISRKASKRDEALKLGAGDYLATDDDVGWYKKYYNKLDLIVSTVASSKAPIKGYLAMLKRHGTLVQVGNPDDGQFALPQSTLIMKSLNFAGSSIGSAAEIREMLQLAADKKIKAWVEERPMHEANQAVLDLEEGKPRYRYCLMNQVAPKL
ncbi:zinc-binding dehydrogenase [Pseudomassariella vexata]|uniref:alcohol dehydrogenase (NADP(+)) n=1 Tax=Pseudomassariella vexata TaxID=1141098 RepID=A0A1Y2EHJ6_9PEZI|nr:zinc-binding dehydrogenase [Pseudomassariella vexata]ORY71040.1 zinc-binding dehydrogenase [Pseudomassariella vexata]